MLQHSREVIDPGQEPWAFVFLEPPTRDDPAAGRQITIGGIADKPTLTVDLGAVISISAVCFAVDDPKVSEVSFAVFNSITRSDWSPGLTQATKATMVAEKTVPDTTGTVGLVERIGGVSFEWELNIKARFIHLEIQLWKHWEGRSVLGMPCIQVLAPSLTVDNDLSFARPETDDGNWEQVGISHCFNDLDTYLNALEAPIRRGTSWYRRRLHLDENLPGRRLYLYFEGVNVATAVYVNGRFKPGVTVAQQPREVAHVGGFLPFTIHITDDAQPGDNVIAVRISNAEHSFFIWPGSGVYTGFCMGWGLVCPVRLVTTSEVYIPLDAFTAGDRHGSYVATISATRERTEVRSLVAGSFPCAPKVAMPPSSPLPWWMPPGSGTRKRIILSGSKCPAQRLTAARTISTPPLASPWVIIHLEILNCKLRAG